jgi:hypothetical protein
MKRLCVPLVMALCFCVGCGGDDEWAAKRPKIYRAGGVVNLDGKPLDDAIVVYHSVTHNVSAQGTTDKNGRFTLTTYNEKDGAADGPQKVVVTKRIYVEQKTKYHSAEEPSVAKIPKDLLPVRYSNPSTTDIEVTVNASGSNDAVIELKSK